MSNRTVDIAVLSETVKFSPEEFDGHIVELNAIDISENDFRDLFYASNGHEIFALNCANELDKTNITFNTQVYQGADLGIELSFNLLNQVLTSYSEDLAVPRECFEPCSLIDIEKQLTNIRTLCDICEVKCSLRWSEVIATLRSLGATLDADVIHRLRVNALFTNANPQLKDIMVRFNYDVRLNNNYTTWGLLA